MENRKSFEPQQLNRKDYEKEEDTAKLIKSGSALAGFLAIAYVGIKKYGPQALKLVSKIIKR